MGIDLGRSVARKGRRAWETSQESRPGRGRPKCYIGGRNPPTDRATSTLGPPPQVGLGAAAVAGSAYSDRQGASRLATASYVTALKCPHCDAMLAASLDMQGRHFACPGCRGEFLVPAVEDPWANLPKPAHCRDRVPRRATGQRIVIAGVLGAAVALVPSVGLGVVLSQYWPVFGGVLGAIGQPFSDAKMSLIPIHCLAFAIGGMVLGFAVGCIWRYSTLLGPTTAGLSGSLRYPQTRGNRRLYRAGKSEHAARYRWLLLSTCPFS